MKTVSRILPLSLVAAAPLALGGCNREPPVAIGPPVGYGAMPETVAADRNGDGVADGFYDAEGLYHPFQSVECRPSSPVVMPPENAPGQPFAPPPPVPAGERG